jgi:hypothetical protein
VYRTDAKKSKYKQNKIEKKPKRWQNAQFFLFRTKIEFKNPKREKLDNKMIRHSGYYTQMEITEHKARMSTTTILYNT